MLENRLSKTPGYENSIVILVRQDKLSYYFGGGDVNKY